MLSSMQQPGTFELLPLELSLEGYFGGSSDSGSSDGGAADFPPSLYHDTDAELHAAGLMVAIFDADPCSSVADSDALTVPWLDMTTTTTVTTSSSSASSLRGASDGGGEDEASGVPSWLLDLAQEDVVSAMIDGDSVLNTSTFHPTVVEKGPVVAAPMVGGGKGSGKRMPKRKQAPAAARSHSKKRPRAGSRPVRPCAQVPPSSVMARAEVGRTLTVLQSGKSSTAAIAHSMPLVCLSKSNLRRSTRLHSQVLSVCRGSVAAEAGEGDKENRGWHSHSNDNDNYNSYGKDDDDADFTPTAATGRRKKATRGSGKRKARTAAAAHLPSVVVPKRRSPKPASIQRTSACQGEVAESRRELLHADWSLHLLAMDPIETNKFFGAHVAAWVLEQKETRSQLAGGRGTPVKTARDASRGGIVKVTGPFSKSHREDFRLYRRKLKNRWYQARSNWELFKKSPAKATKNARFAVNDPSVRALLGNIDSLQARVDAETKALAARAKELDGMLGTGAAENVFVEVDSRQRQHMQRKHFEELNRMLQSNWWGRFQGLF